MTLHRAKAMLEQSHVAIAGVVFNGLTEDINNWSSYGYASVSLVERQGDREPIAAGGGVLPEPAPMACREAPAATKRGST